jgi:hypothetical protein
MPPLLSAENRIREERCEIPGAENPIFACAAITRAQACADHVVALCMPEHGAPRLQMPCRRSRSTPPALRNTGESSVREPLCRQPQHIQDMMRAVPNGADMAVRAV